MAGADRSRRDDARPVPRRARALLVLLLTTRAALAADTSDPAADLPAIRARIEALERDLDAHRIALATARATLTSLAREIRTIQAAQRRRPVDIAAKTAEIARLEIERARLRETLGGSTGLVAGALRARFALDREPKIKFLLSPDRLNAAQRELRCFDYVVAAANGQITGAEQKLADYAAVQQALKLETDRLKLLRVAQATRLADLDAALAARRAAATALEAATRAEARRLAELKRGMKRLETLIAQLHVHAASPTPGEAADGPAFAARRGRLSWPLAGRVTQIDREASEPGGANWSGVFIAAPATTPVHAVAAGRVVFADEFVNLGRLVILDHGDGYLSLYGHNARLDKQAGDEVTAGETIATTGASHGQTEASLYFEIRHNGKPENPLLWCK